MIALQQQNINHGRIYHYNVITSFMSDIGTTFNLNKLLLFHFPVIVCATAKAVKVLDIKVVNF